MYYNLNGVSMKKILLITCLLILCSCETKESKIKKEEEKKLNDLTNSVEKSSNPDSTKEWLISVAKDKVLTIFCISTSSKCSKINENINNIKGSKVYYLNLDELTDDEKNVYKTKFDISDYTSYVPYLILSDEDKLIKTGTDIYEINSINEFIKNDVNK